MSVSRLRPGQRRRFGRTSSPSTSRRVKWPMGTQSVELAGIRCGWAVRPSSMNLTDARG